MSNEVHVMVMTTTDFYRAGIAIGLGIAGGVALSLILSFILSGLTKFITVKLLGYRPDPRP